MVCRPRCCCLWRGFLCLHSRCVFCPSYPSGRKFTFHAGKQIAGDIHWRMVIIFATRSIADEWWRAVSTSDIPILKGNIKRVTPQFYTHDTGQWNVYEFFTEQRIHQIAERFRGKMFLVLENDRPGRGITIIPTQSIVDHASGDWWVSTGGTIIFYILISFQVFHSFQSQCRPLLVLRRGPGMHHCL